MGVSGSSGSGDSTITTRYATYIEENHESFLDSVASYRVSATDDSPYDGYTNIEIDDAFFGSGYAIASFPSLYDMYGKFLGGMDIEAMFDEIFEDTVNSSQVSDLVSAESTFLDNEIEANVLPDYELGARDVNAAMNDSYVIGKALIREARVNSVAKFSAELKYRLIPVAAERWRAHLTWNQQTIATYIEVMKLYFSAKMDVTGFNYTMLAKDKIWPFTVLEFERAALGALQGARTESRDTEDSGSSSFLSILSAGVGLASLFI